MIGLLTKQTVNHSNLFTIYTVPSGKNACINIHFVQEPSYSSNLDVRVYVCPITTPTPGTDDFFMTFDLDSTNYNVRTKIISGLLLRENFKVMAKLDAAALVIISAYGIEETILV
ncbi:MAG: hypothetical protein IPL99_12225 [Candidatus Competibacteraceae bacterium]|nr:hypothetical protein [Candidatus Competibacteraceae bacterium]